MRLPASSNVPLRRARLLGSAKTQPFQRSFVEHDLSDAGRVPLVGAPKRGRDRVQHHAGVLEEPANSSRLLHSRHHRRVIVPL